MRRAVDEFRRTAKDLDSRLNILEWKVETLLQNDITKESTRNSEGEETGNISVLIRDVSQVKKNFSAIKQDLRVIVDTHKESMEQLHDKMDSISERFSKISQIISVPQE